MKRTYKIIRDSIHGDIKLEGIFQDLLDSPEIQRLSSIKQLGLAHLVFPGAHHTRLEHSLGAYHMAYALSDSLSLSEDDHDLIQCAALLHDIGHGPFSHTLEFLVREIYNVDHVDLTEKLIMGDYDIFQDHEVPDLSEFKRVTDILDSYGIDKKKIVDIIRGNEKEKPFLGEMLNSVIDVDQLDYLLRDSYYTGVAYGMIDSQRFVQTLDIQENHLALDRKGVGVIENVLMARALMYSSVYFHKTVRIAELMLSKSFETIPDVEPFEFFKMNDGELIEEFKRKGEFQRKMVTRLKYRQLFKQAYVLLPHQRNERNLELVSHLEDVSFRREMEARFEETLSIPKGHIIIDTPSIDLHQAEPRIQEIDMPIVDEGKVKTLTHYTPVAEAISMRSIPDWDVMILTDDQYRKQVSDNAERILYS